jgi:hypothetical protein
MDKVYENFHLRDLVNSYVCIRNPIFILGNSTNSFQLNSQYWIGKLESIDGFVQTETIPPSPSQKINTTNWRKFKP